MTDNVALLAFAAGIMAGEGCINNATRGTADGRRPVNFSVQMLDHWSVEQVALAISPALPRWQDHTDCRVSYQEHKKGGVFARIHLGGARAVAATLVLWPWLYRTDKAGQARRAFTIAGLESPEVMHSLTFPDRPRIMLPTAKRARRFT